MNDLSALTWRRSTWCAAANCVEVSNADGAVAVRDSKRTDGAVLVYTSDEWRAFVQGVKAGEFDIPVQE